MKDREPAFPGAYFFNVPFGPNETRKEKEYMPGMSLRDWFAGMALIGELSADRNDRLTEEIICQRAWNMADAMLKEREK